MDIKPPAADLVDRLVYANRILYDQNIVDGLGHVSVRHDSEPGAFLLSCNRAPGMVRRRDITTYDFDGNTLSDQTERPYLERFIHGEIYRARPDVVAVVHSHSPSVIPYAGSSVRLRPIYHMAGFLGAGAPVFDIRCCFGDTDMLVRNRDHGKALAATLGQGTISLMRGHGFVAAGRDIQVAVYRAVYTEMNAALQQKAIGLGGDITYLNDAEAALADEMMGGVMSRPWELWKKKAFD